MIDWLAGGIELTAKVVVGRKLWWGHAMHLCSGALWTTVALQTHVYGLLIITVPAFVINTYNMVRWWRER